MAEAASVGFSHLVDEATNVTELRILEKRDPHYAVRIKRMAELNDAQQDMVAYCLNKSHFFKTMGDKWKVWGDLLYATQVTGSAIVPVLIGVLGSFDSAFIDACIRVLAIVLSLAAAICAALEGVYSYRLRGQVRRGFGDNLNDLFQSFETLSGPLFDPTCSARRESKPAQRPGEGSFVMPDLSHIPRAVLRAQLDHLDQLDTAKKKEKSPDASLPRPQTHVDMYRLFAAEVVALNAQARKAAFVGQDVGAGHSASGQIEREGEGQTAAT